MKLLVHICCAPCSVYPVGTLQKEDIYFEGYFYNPNIHPAEEFQRRRENVERFSDIKGFHVHYLDDTRQDLWEGFSGPGFERCRMCYRMRLDKAASFAREKGFDAFTTTLLVSPYQKHDLIKELGREFEAKYGVEFFYRDFRPGFRQGQQQAKELGLYRQKFCGCIVSLREQSEAQNRKTVNKDGR